MLALNQIEEALATSEEPLVKQIYNRAGKQLLGVGLRKGVELREQVAPVQTKIMMIKGEIDLNTATHSYRLERFDTFDIPIEVVHTIVGVYDAIFLILRRHKQEA